MDNTGVYLLGKKERALLHKTLSFQYASGSKTSAYDIDKSIKRLYALVAEAVGKEYADIERDNAGNIYVTKGEGPYPCAVSHYDQVHTPSASFEVHYTNDGGAAYAINSASMRQVGVGGDDKVGMFLCLLALKRFENVKVVFFEGEELGCIGSSQANMSFFEDCKVVIQADRRGGRDFCGITNGMVCAPGAWLEDIKPLLDSYGYSEATGTITDVGTLRRRGLRAPSANISCGYYAPHSSSEFIDINEMIIAGALMFKIFDMEDKPEYHTHPTLHVRHYGAAKHYGAVKYPLSRWGGQWQGALGDDTWGDDGEDEWDNGEPEPPLDENIYICPSCAEASVLLFSETGEYECVMCGTIYTPDEVKDMELLSPHAPSAICPDCETPTEVKDETEDCYYCPTCDKLFKVKQ